MNKNHTGLALGLLLGLVHVVWSLLVAAGWAQPLLDWVLKMHMLSESVRALPFDFGSAITLVVVAFVVGYVLGWVFAWLWNWLKK